MSTSILSCPGILSISDHTHRRGDMEIIAILAGAAAFAMVMACICVILRWIDEDDR